MKTNVKPNNPVTNFISAKRGLFWHFNCRDEYFVRCLEGYRWEIKNEGDLYFLSYWLDGDGKITSCVIVRKDNAPLIFTAGEYTMAVAIDCVKIAFVLENALKSPGDLNE